MREQNREQNCEQNCKQTKLIAFAPSPKVTSTYSTHHSPLPRATGHAVDVLVPRCSPPSQPLLPSSREQLAIWNKVSRHMHPSDCDPHPRGSIELEEWLMRAPGSNRVYIRAPLPSDPSEAAQLSLLKITQDDHGNRLIRKPHPDRLWQSSRRNLPWSTLSQPLGLRIPSSARARRPRRTDILSS